MRTPILNSKNFDDPPPHILLNYNTGIHALVSRWHKAVEDDGDYVEKLRV
jgi:hypothetical protein